MDNIKQDIRHFIVDHFLFGEDPGFTDDASLLDQGFIDSTGVLEFVAFIEKQYHVKVSDEELAPENLDSVVSVAAFVARKQAAAA